MKTIFKTLSFIISIGIALSANTAFAGKENPLLLALKINVVATMQEKIHGEVIFLDLQLITLFMEVDGGMDLEID